MKITNSKNLLFPAIKGGCLGCYTSKHKGYFNLNRHSLLFGIFNGALCPYSTAVVRWKRIRDKL